MIAFAIGSPISWSARSQLARATARSAKPGPLASSLDRRAAAMQARAAVERQLARLRFDKLKARAGKGRWTEPWRTLDALLEHDPAGAEAGELCGFSGGVGQSLEFGEHLHRGTDPIACGLSQVNEAGTEAVAASFRILDNEKPGFESEKHAVYRGTFESRPGAQATDAVLAVLSESNEHVQRSQHRLRCFGLSWHGTPLRVGAQCLILHGYYTPRASQAANEVNMGKS